MRCGHRIDRLTLVNKVKKAFSNPMVVGGLAVLFVLLLFALIFAQGLGSSAQTDVEAGTGLAAEAGGPVNMPPLTATPTQQATRPPVIQVPEVISLPANVTQNATPRPLETVLSVRTLDRYVQDAGGDGDDLFGTISPSISITLPQPTMVPGPTSTIVPGPVGNLVWAGEGNYVTAPFSLDAGEVRLELAAQELTMAQLLDANRTVLGLVTAGPNPGGTTIRIPTSGDCRVEVWPFGSGLWTVRVTKVATMTPTDIPSTTGVPVSIPSSAPSSTTLPSPSTSSVPTPSLLPEPAVTATPNETMTTTPMASPTLTPPPTQAPHTFTGNGTAVTPYFQLTPGIALFHYLYRAEGQFSITLLDGSGAVVDRLVEVNGTVSGSKAVGIQRLENYLLSVEAEGGWEISVG